ncbi:MAG: hypothetical protein IPH69_06490 [Bacteroidales bacterium]|nr:hypothetical protein [Bacteroidales bacterium]
MEKTLHIDEVDFFIGKNYIITVSGHNSDSRRPLVNIESIVSKDSLNAKSGPAFLLHILIDYLVDQKFEAFDALEDDLETAEDEVIDNCLGFNPKGLRLKGSSESQEKSFHERRSCEDLPPGLSVHI